MVTGGFGSERGRGRNLLFQVVAKDVLRDGEHIFRAFPVLTTKPVNYFIVRKKNCIFAASHVADCGNEDASQCPVVACFHHHEYDKHFIP